MGTSRSFGSKVPALAHLLRSKGGLSGEINDLRSDLDEAFIAAETEIDTITGSALGPFIPTSQRAAALGVATLDADGKIPSVQLTTALVGSLHYEGVLDASAATYPPAPTIGEYWVISVAGTIAGTVYKIGDIALWNGTDWDRLNQVSILSQIANDSNGPGVTATDAFNRLLVAATYATEEALTIELDQVGGVNPRLYKPITRQAEVPATAFRDPWALIAALPKRVDHAVVIQLKSNVVGPTTGTSFGAPVFDFQGFTGAGNITVQGERTLLLTQVSPAQLSTNSWDILLSGPGLLNAFLGKFLEVTGGTGEGQESLVRLNAAGMVTYNLKVLSGFAVPVDVDSLINVWEPKWKISGLKSGAAWSRAAVLAEHCSIPITVSEVTLSGSYGFAALSRNCTEALELDHCSVVPEAGSSEILVADRGKLFLQNCYSALDVDVYQPSYNLSDDTASYGGWVTAYRTMFDGRSISVEGKSQVYLISVLMHADHGLELLDGARCYLYSEQTDGGVQLVSDPTLGGSLFTDCAGIRLVGPDTVLTLDPGSSIDLQSTTAGISVEKGALLFAQGALIYGAGNTRALKVVSGSKVFVTRTAGTTANDTLQLAATREIEMDDPSIARTFVELYAYSRLESPSFGTGIYAGDMNTQAFIHRGERFSGIASFTDESVKAVTIPSVVGAAYAVKLTPSVNTTVWYTDRTATGFNIQAGAEITGEVSWEITQL